MWPDKCISIFRMRTPIIMFGNAPLGMLVALMSIPVDTISSVVMAAMLLLTKSNRGLIQLAKSAPTSFPPWAIPLPFEIFFMDQCPFSGGGAD